MRRGSSAARSSKGFRTVVGVATGALLAVAAGCGRPGVAPGARAPTGSAFVHVSAMGATDVTGATFTVTGPGIPIPLSGALARSEGVWQTTLGGIPAGSDRTFTLSATGASGAERYRGQATGVTVAADRTEDVLIVAQQTSAPAGFDDAAPVIDLVQTSSAAVAPGGAVTLTVRAHDPDAGDSLTYRWAAGAGALSSPDLPSTTWTAPATPGTYAVAVTVADSKGTIVSASVQLSVTGAPPPAPDAPSSAPLPPWAHALLLAGLLVAGLRALGRRGQNPLPRMAYAVAAPTPGSCPSWRNGRPKAWARPRRRSVTAK